MALRDFVRARFCLAFPTVCVYLFRHHSTLSELTERCRPCFTGSCHPCFYLLFRAVKQSSNEVGFCIRRGFAPRMVMYTSGLRRNPFPLLIFIMIHMICFYTKMRLPISPLKYCVRVLFAFRQMLYEFVSALRGRERQDSNLRQNFLLPTELRSQSGILLKPRYFDFPILGLYVQRRTILYFPRETSCRG